MPRVKTSDTNSKQYYAKNIEELKSYKYLLGEFGIAMLNAVNQGAQDPDSIMMLSGVPAACITGRMPILLNLDLVISKDSGLYFVSKKGKQFLKCLESKTKGKK